MFLLQPFFVFIYIHSIRFQIPANLSSVMTQKQVHLLDYGAGNVRSLVNAVNRLGYSLIPIQSEADFEKAEVTLLFPGSVVTSPLINFQVDHFSRCGSFWSCYEQIT